MIVLFCGKGNFQAGYDMTKDSLKDLEDIEVIQCDREDIPIFIESATVVIPLMSKLTREHLSKARNLKLIIQYGAGVEGIDIEAASEYGIYVSKIPSNECSNALSCSEHAIFLSLALLRDYNELQNSIRHGLLGLPCGKTIYGSNIAIFGLGGIGLELVKRLSVFGVNIYAVVRKIPSEESRDSITRHVGKFITIDIWDTIAHDIDIIILCCPLTKDNFGMVNDQFLEYLKMGCILINVARGGLLNYADVLKALNSGKLGGLGIDVYHTEPFPTNCDDPILSHPKVIATPHVAGVTQRSYKEMAEIVSYNVRQILHNQPCTGVVNNDIIRHK